MTNPRRPSMFRQLIRGAATRIANDPRIPAENRAALAQHAEHVIWHEWRELFGGDVVNLRAPDIEPGQREARAQRVASAIAAGQSSVDVAKNEGISPSAIRMQRHRLTRHK
jgi:DNA-binding NarL/FixJ family response regulator